MFLNDVVLLGQIILQIVEFTIVDEAVALISHGTGFILMEIGIGSIRPAADVGK